MTITDLLAQATDPDATAPECAAALSAAARIVGQPDPTWPLPQGYGWRDGRVVPEASCLPALKRKVRSRWDEPAEEVPEPSAPVVTEEARPPKRRGPGKHIGRKGTRSQTLELICAMIARPEGASTDELIDATGLSPLGLRVAISSLRSLARTGATYDRDRGRYVDPGSASKAA